MVFFSLCHSLHISLSCWVSSAQLLLACMFEQSSKSCTLLMTESPHPSGAEHRYVQIQRVGVGENHNLYGFLYMYV